MATEAKSTNKQPQLDGAFSLFMPSWEAVKLNIITFIELVGIPILINVLGSIVDRGGVTTTGSILRLLAVISAIALAPAIIVTQLSSARRKTIDFGEALQTGLTFLWRYIGLAICMAVVITVGFILFIIPGLFMLRRYYLAPFYLIDRNLRVFEAMEVSAKESKQFSWAIWGVIGVQILFALLSIIFIGIIFAVMYYCAPALRYLEIKQAAKRKNPAKA